MNLLVSEYINAEVRLVTKILLHINATEITVNSGDNFCYVQILESLQQLLHNKFIASQVVNKKFINNKKIIKIC
jgi:hypothetical protein